MRFSGRTFAYAGVGLIVVVITIIATVGGGEKQSDKQDSSVAQKARQREMRVPGAERDTRSEWDRLAPKLDPAKALELLEKDRLEEKNIALRAERAAQIIAQLCRNGYSKEAWNLIDVNEGLVREKSLGGFFHDANLPHAEIVSLVEGLHTQERAVSMQGYWGRFSPEEFAQMDLTDMPLRSKNEQGVFRRTIETKLAEIYDANNLEGSVQLRKNLLKQVAKLMNNQTLEYWHIGDLVNKDPSKDGFSYWEIAKTVVSTTRNPQPPYNGADSSIIRTMTIQDPERLMTMTLVPETPEAKSMHIAMEQWLISDYDKAASWYESNKGGFDAALRDRAAAAFMRASAKRRNYQEALSWYAALEGDTWKSGMKREKQMIEKQLKAQ